jgi:hypothetical protein
MPIPAPPEFRQPRADAQNLFTNRSMKVTDFIGRFRKGGIREVFPSEFMDKTIDEALRLAGSTVRKLLTDGRFVR